MAAFIVITTLIIVAGTFLLIFLAWLPARKEARAWLKEIGLRWRFFGKGQLGHQSILQPTFPTPATPALQPSPDCNSEDQLPSASAYVVRSFQKLISTLENNEQFGDVEVENSIESCLEGREHLLRPIRAYLTRVFWKARASAGVSAAAVVVRAARRFLQVLDRAQAGAANGACEILQDSGRGLVETIVLADFSLPVAKALDQLALNNPEKKKSVRVHLVPCGEHIASTIDTRRWKEALATKAMARFYNIDSPIPYEKVGHFFETLGAMGKRTMFLLGAERVYPDGKFFDWPGMRVICLHAKRCGIEVLVVAESYKVQPLLKGEVPGSGTAVDGKPIELVPMPLEPGIRFVSDHMVHAVSDERNGRPVSLKCCYRNWLNQMEERNLPLGVVFDLDGTLIDSEAVHKSLYQEIAKTLGYSLSDQEYNSTLRGMTDDETIGAIIQRAGKPANKEKLISRKQGEFAKYLTSGNVKPIPGAVEFVRKIYEQSHVLALATSATDWEATTALEHLGILDLFSAIVSVGKGNPSKPLPDVYERVVRSLRLRQWECVVYEDSLNGIKSAIDAGIEVVAVGDPANEILKGLKVKTIIPDFVNRELPEIEQRGR